MSIHIAQPGGPPQEVELGSALPKVLPVLPLKDSVPFPDTLTPLAVGQERSVRLVNEVLGGNRMLVMVASKNPEIETPGPEDLYRVGVAGVVARMLKVPDGTLRILVQGGQRVVLEEFVATEPYLAARIEPAPDVIEQTPELEALFRNDETQAEVNELREQIEAADLPEHALKQAERELQRFERLPPQSAEHGVIRGYLEWIVSLPWSVSTEDHIDLKKARKVLDRDHYDIEKVKERILEFLAVRSLKPDARSSILCFVGPPGVGKTSLGRSVAEAMGRNFERLSVGGVRDESEIRGHRRTYIGALPGTILRAMRDAGSNNPVLMIDEIDKMGADFRGDPSSAMLEVLDPEQNQNFRDHYLDLPFDLSNVFFICTANQLDPIPRPLLDRMEVIELSGYTEEEKLEIAKRYLVPRQMERNGLTKSKIEFTDDSLKAIIEGYTREAGVRNLERQVASGCRNGA